MRNVNKFSFKIRPVSSGYKTSAPLILNKRHIFTFDFYLNFLFYFILYAFAVPANFKYWPVDTLRTYFVANLTDRSFPSHALVRKINSTESNSSYAFQLIIIIYTQGAQVCFSINYYQQSYIVIE